MKLHLDLSKYPGDIKKRLDYIAHSGIEGILTENFFQKYTKYQNVVNFFNSIGCDLTDPNLNNDLEDGKYDDAIQQQTPFSSWEALYNQAVQELLEKR